MWRKKNVSMESIIFTSSAPFKAGSIIQRPRKLEIMHYCVQLWSEKVQCLLPVLRLFPVPIEQLTNVQMLSLQFYIALIVWQNLGARARDVFSTISRPAPAWRVAGLSFSKLFLGIVGFSKLWESAHSATPDSFDIIYLIPFNPYWGVLTRKMFQDRTVPGLQNINLWNVKSWHTDCEHVKL